MVRSYALFAAVATASVLSIADAHSNMNKPAPYWPEGFYNGNSPIGTIDSKQFTGAAASIAGHEGVKKLSTYLNGGDLRDFVYKNVKIDLAGANKECGKTLLTGTPYPVPAEVDFPWGHPGACAAYCDDNKFFQNDNCQANAAGPLKVDQAKCAGAKRLQVMYVGVHVEAYQVYINCVPLAGGGGGGGGGASTGGNSGGNNGGNNGGNSGNSGGNNGGSSGGNNGGNNGGSNGGNNGGNNGNNSGGNNGGNSVNNNGGNNGNNNGGGNNGNNNGGGNNGNNNGGNNGNNNGGNNGNNNGGNSGGNAGGNFSDEYDCDESAGNNNNGGNNNNNSNNNNGGNSNQNNRNNGNRSGGWGGQRSFDFDDLGKRQLRSE